MAVDVLFYSVSSWIKLETQLSFWPNVINGFQPTSFKTIGI